MKKQTTIPDLILGTAMWGWTVPKESCFALLDHFYHAGFRQVDGATNYPINQEEADFRKSEKILAEWVKTHGVNDLQVMMKVGSINNMRSPDHNLQKSFLLICLDEYQAIFGPNLDTFMIHWDNRDQKKAIDPTMEALQLAAQSGLRVGLSGIKHPEVYAALNQKHQLDFRIQIKHNLLYSDYDQYASFHGSRRFITYGINAGGLKLKPMEYREDSTLKARGADLTNRPDILDGIGKLLERTSAPVPQRPLSTFNHCGMVYAYHSPDIQGILIGPSQIQQLADTIGFYRDLQAGVYYNFYQKLIGVKQLYAKK